jgi:hypothetical protein
MSAGFWFTLGALGALALIGAAAVAVLMVVGYASQTIHDVRDYWEWRDDPHRRRAPNAWTYTWLAGRINVFRTHQVRANPSPDGERS